MSDGDTRGIRPKRCARVRPRTEGQLMTPDEAIERLRAALDQIDAVETAGRDGSAGVEWRLSTSLLFDEVFDVEHQFTQSHRSVPYNIPHGSILTGEPESEMRRLAREAWVRAMDTHRGILRAAIAFVEREGLPKATPKTVQANVQPRIFLSHGSAENVLDAVSRFVEDLGFVPVVMKRSATQGAAVDDAVPALMDSCDAIVVLATADDKQQDETFNPRPNVIHEIGLAQSMMPTRIIYLKEDGAVFPSNIAPKLWESFERGNYGPVFSKLVREFRAFGFI